MPGSAPSSSAAGAVAAAAAGGGGGVGPVAVSPVSRKPTSRLAIATYTDGSEDDGNRVRDSADANSSHIRHVNQGGGFPEASTLKVTDGIPASPSLSPTISPTFARLLERQQLKVPRQQSSGIDRTSSDTSTEQPGVIRTLSAPTKHKSPLPSYTLSIPSPQLPSSPGSVNSPHSPFEALINMSRGEGSFPPTPTRLHASPCRPQRTLLGLVDPRQEKMAALAQASHCSSSLSLPLQAFSSSLRPHTAEGGRGHGFGLGLQVSERLLRRRRTTLAVARQITSTHGTAAVHAKVAT